MLAILISRFRRTVSCNDSKNRDVLLYIHVGLHIYGLHCQWDCNAGCDSLCVIACSESMKRGHVGDHCSYSNMPALCKSSDDSNHHYYLHHPIYCQLTDGAYDSIASSIDVQFHSSAASSMTSEHPLPLQLARWKPVSNIPERWSREILNPSAGCCECVM